MESSPASPANGTTTLSPRNRLEAFQGLMQRVGHTAAERTKATDKLVRSHPYHAVGLVLGLGMLIGAIIGRKWRA